MGTVPFSFSGFIVTLCLSDFSKSEDMLVKIENRTKLSFYWRIEDQNLAYNQNGGIELS
jgi:hypothetical protein